MIVCDRIYHIDDGIVYVEVPVTILKKYGWSEEFLIDYMIQEYINE